MQIWMNLLLAVQILSALVMIGLVLVQHGKGADMGASFGSGSSGSLFGATGSANFLSRSTAACATVFFVSTLLLALLCALPLGRALDALQLGERSAASLGIPVKLIVHPQPGLFGAAAAFAAEHGEPA